MVLLFRQPSQEAHREKRMNVKHRLCVIRQNVAKRRGPDKPCTVDKALHRLEASANRSRQDVEAGIRRQVTRDAEKPLADCAIHFRGRLRPVHRADGPSFRQQAFDDRLADSAGRARDNRAKVHRQFTPAECARSATVEHCMNSSTDRRLP